MTSNKQKIGIVLFAVILLFSLLTLVYWTFVRDTIIVPIYYSMWVTDLALKSVPQAVFLAILIFICLLIGVNTLLSIRVRQFTRGAVEPPAPNDSRYTVWKRLCSNLYSGTFVQDAFAWEARKLILSIHAYEHGIEINQAEAMIRNGRLPVPAPVKILIEEKKIQYFEGVSQPAPNIIVRLRCWLFPVEDPQKKLIDDAVTEIVAYVEDLLEIDHA